MVDILYKDESYAIMGACFAVYKDKGCGFLEPVYQECLAIELAASDVPFTAQPELPLDYKGQPLSQTYRPDFVGFDKVVVEIKAASALTDAHRAQLLNYLHAGSFRLGLLVNFGHYPGLEHERLVL